MLSDADYIPEETNMITMLLQIILIIFKSAIRTVGWGGGGGGKQ